MKICFYWGKNAFILFKIWNWDDGYKNYNLYYCNFYLVRGIKIGVIKKKFWELLFGIK